MYKAVAIADGMYVCVCGEDYMNATIHDTMSEAVSKARYMNSISV